MLLEELIEKENYYESECKNKDEECNCHWRFILTNSNNFKRERYTVRLKLQIKQRTKTITI